MLLRRCKRCTCRWCDFEHQQKPNKNSNNNASIKALITATATMSDCHDSGLMTTYSIRNDENGVLVILFNSHRESISAAKKFGSKDSHLWVNFTNEATLIVTIIDFNISIYETGALLQVIQVLNPNLFRIF